MIIGYTTGVFDMFHVGHLNILKFARANCDYLIVGVSTDELVQSYKYRLPVIPYSDRFAIVESVKYVDKVIPQSHRDKIQQYHEINYDVMFVGDDWRGSDIFNATESFLHSLGKKIVYIPYTHHVSSTLFREFLQKDSTGSC
jgi:glycerol-3-phosphate cytidylyltransferase